MKKNIMRPIVCLLAATVFLMPLMGNTALADESTVTYHFNSYDDESEAWETHPENMTDGDEDTYASTVENGRVQLCDDNAYSGGGSGRITKVELQVKGYYEDDQRDIILQPLFNGKAGDNHPYVTTTNPDYSSWFEITGDTNAPETWAWTDVDNLGCKVKAEDPVMGQGFTLYCSIVLVRITYTT